MWKLVTLLFVFGKCAVVSQRDGTSSGEGGVGVGSGGGLIDALVDLIASDGDATDVTEEIEEELPLDNPTNETEVESPGDTPISYVLDGFERIDLNWFWPGDTSIGPRGPLRISNRDQLFGNGALSVGPNETLPSREFGYILPDRPHNCDGAESVSIWAKKSGENLTATFSLSFLDDTSCVQSREVGTCNAREDFDTVPVFQDMTIPLGNIWTEFSANIEDLEGLNPRRIRGWIINVENLEGQVFVDQLACHGGGRLFGAAFSASSDIPLNQSIAEGTWRDSYYQSEIAKNSSITTLTDDSRMEFKYVVEQTEVWGGFNDIAHLAAGNGYYNLSGANGMVLDFNTIEPASNAGRAIFRLVLQDSSDCEGNSTICSSDYHATERWYSFHSILDDIADGQIAIPLIGSLDAVTPFWLTLWSGIPGNRQLDISQIKGFTLEIVLDSVLELGETVSGAFSISKMAAAIVPTQRFDAGYCIVEENMKFFEDFGRFKKLEFLGEQCCDICSADPNCFYGLSTGRDCFIGPEIEHGFVGLTSNEINQNHISFWANDPVKRGAWCEKCACRKEDRSIDCRDRNLAIVPQAYDEAWMPEIIDLRGNTNLVVVGTGSLKEVDSNLKELRLPFFLKHLSTEILGSISTLEKVAFESGDSSNFISNVVTGPSDFFADICCSQGDEISIGGLPMSFCNLTLHSPGIDSTYLPFLNLRDASTKSALSASASFMAEAAESAEKCAEYCTIDNECSYFQYDARLPNAEHVCLLLEDKGTIFDDVCCDPDHYADEAQSVPGFIAGIPPRTRHTDEDAQVYISTSDLILSEQNGYSSEFEIYLGSSPKRGAVWIETSMIPSALNVDLSIWPARVALYDSVSSQIVRVSLADVESGINDATIILRNKIISCDEAFEVQQNSNQTLVVVTVDIPFQSSSNRTGLAIGLSVGFLVLFVFALLLWLERRKQLNNDHVWIVKQNELKFDDPPEVIGRGTFGLVLLAEYRGTRVAVKRVLPSLKKKADPKGLESSPPFADSTGGTSVENSSARVNFELGTSSTDASDRVDKGIESSESNPVESKREASGIRSGQNALMQQSNKSMRSGFAMSTLRKKSQRNGSSDFQVWKRLKTEFVQEMRQLSKLRHPCITTVMGAVIGSNRVEPMLIMEYMEHGSLFDILHNETFAIEADLLLPILSDISQGMRFLHSAEPPVIHGDLKAANILVDSKFRAKVADFGLTQKKNLGGTGTPFWMAPELLRFESTNTTKTDIYSFGIILYEVYSRREPYEGEDYEKVLKEVADKEIQKRPSPPSHCPSQIQSLLTDCLVDDPTKRPTFQEIDTRLRRIDSKDLESQVTKVASVSLFDIFPRHIAEALRDGRTVEAEHRESVTIFFSDIVNFTSFSSNLDPRKVAGLLDRLYSKFDELTHKYDIFKVETIGDAYMAVTNLVKDQAEDHAKRIAMFAIDAVNAANTTLIDVDQPSLGNVSIRVGFHSGPVVADVVGTRNPRYCLFGDTVNTSHRMESNSKPDRIHCSKAAADLLRVQAPDLPIRSRGLIPIKGKGEMHTYWVNEASQSRKSFANPSSNQEDNRLSNIKSSTGIGLALALVDSIHMDDASQDEHKTLDV